MKSLLSQVEHISRRKCLQVPHKEVTSVTLPADLLPSSAIIHRALHTITSTSTVASPRVAIVFTIYDHLARPIRQT